MCACESEVRLLVCKQRSALAVLGHNLATLERVLTEKTRDADCEREDEKDGADGKGEDPLELQNRELGEELADAGGCEKLVMIDKLVEGRKGLTES